MSRLTNHYAVMLSVLALILYTLALPAFGYGITKEAVDAAILFVAVVLAWSWAPAAGRAFRSGGTGGAAIVMSLWLAWTALVVQRLWVIAVRWNGRPDWMIESPINGYVGVLIFIAGAYAIVAPVTVDDVPRREIVHMVIAAAMGGLAVGVALTVYFLRGQT